MVNGLHLYSAFTDPMAIKALYITPHPFTHSYNTLTLIIKCKYVITMHQHVAT